MSEPRWTPAQRAAIDDRGGALLVSAAAGSGKTAVLTERAVRLITDPEHPVDADRLLIVTFTNAAAAELRARIGQALLRRCQQEPGNTALRRQRMLLQRAPICTMDAFCLDLLHKHFQALDIPPDFAPADPGSVELLRTAALAETLEHAYADPDFCAFADLYGKGRTDKPAGDTILQVYDFLRALPDYDRKLDEFLAPWQQENGFDATCWHDLLLAQAAPWQTSAIAGCNRFLDRVWALSDKLVEGEGYRPVMETLMHQTIKKVGADIETLKMNTAIAQLMTLVNALYDNGGATKAELETVVQLLNPFAPHMTEELWEKLGHSHNEQLAYYPWPQYEEAKCVESTVEIAVQVNGKVKVRLKVAADIDAAAAIAAAKADPAVAAALEGKQVVKEIYVKGRLVNLAVK